jgi:hypothetical protein
MEESAMKYLLMLWAVALLVAGTSAQAGVFFYDLDGGEQAQWDADLAAYGYTMRSQTNWGALPDWGIAGIDGPVDNHTNNGYFSPGDIPFDLAFDSNYTAGGTGGPNGRGVGGNGLAVFGPSSGWSVSNLLIANYFVDSFDIFDVGGNVVAMELWACTIMGGTTVDINVWDDNANLIGSGVSNAPSPGGWRVGVLVTDADSIGIINLTDPAGGAEGVMAVTTYIPAPGALALLGLAGLVRRRRR